MCTIPLKLIELREQNGSDDMKVNPRVINKHFRDSPSSKEPQMISKPIKLLCSIRLHYLRNYQL